MAKKSFKELNQEVVLLVKKIDLLERKHEERIKNLEAKIEALENLNATTIPKSIEQIQVIETKCEVCNLTYVKKSELENESPKENCIGSFLCDQCILTFMTVECFRFSKIQNYLFNQDILKLNKTFTLN